MKLEPTVTGKHIRTFLQQMTLEQLDKDTFRSTFGANGERLLKHKGRLRPIAYGGQVLAQAVWAAAQTVGHGFVVHSVTGYFLTPALSDVPFVFHVQTVRNGKSYLVRRVDVTQEDSDGLCFTCTCSFKTTEDLALEFQDTRYPEKRYKSFLQDNLPQHGPELVYTDGKELFHFNAYGYTSSLPSIKIGLLPMRDYNKHLDPLDRRHLLYYTVAGGLPPANEAPNLHACNHLYLSDQMSTIAAARHLELEPSVISMASLSATVVFHSGIERLNMCDDSGKEKWFCQELWTDRFSDGRAARHSRMWDDQGRHIATTYQDMQMKVKLDDPSKLAKLKGFVSRGSKI